jgi:Transposase
MVYLGIDWAHHDVCLLDEVGARLGNARARWDRRLGAHSRAARRVHLDSRDRGGGDRDRPRPAGPRVGGGRIPGVLPEPVRRESLPRSTYSVESDPGEAKVLAELVRTDPQNHRPRAGDSELAESLKVLARAHQTLVWARGRHVNQLRSALREFYLAALVALGTDLAAGTSHCSAEHRHLSKYAISRFLNSEGHSSVAGANAALRLAPTNCSERCALRSCSHPHGWQKRTAARCRLWCASWASSMPRLPALRPSLPRLLKTTRTPRSCAVCPDLV